MKYKDHVWIVSGFLICFFVVGIPYWQIPYDEINLPGAILNSRLWVVVILSAVVFLMEHRTFRNNVMVMGLSVPAVIIVRAAWDLMLDPSSHNLLPFELIIAAAIGFPCSLSGTVMGFLAGKLLPDRLKRDVRQVK